MRLRHLAGGLIGWLFGTAMAVVIVVLLGMPVSTTPLLVGTVVGGALSGLVISLVVLAVKR